MGITIDGEDDDIIPYYETYSKKKHAYRNVFIKVLPSPIEMQQIREGVDEQMSDFQQEVQVQLKEKSLSIQQSLEAGEIIPERAEIEIDRAAKMTEQAIEEIRRYRSGSIETSEQEAVILHFSQNIQKRTK